ncbi:MAG: P-II family nitrogen regulator [Candidatus Hadarchaeia archaeon]
MKKIEAMIRREKLEDVRSALDEVGYPGMTLTKVKGHGKQKGVTEQFRGREYEVDLLPKIKLEIVAPDDTIEEIVKTISENAKTGDVGDGKIFILEVEKAVKIRTGKEGEDAL